MASDVILNSKWDRLPFYILVEIFSYLSFHDRQKASAACKSWNTAYHSPYLWRSLYCVFHCTGLNFQTNKVILKNEDASFVASHFGHSCLNLTVDIQLLEPESYFQEPHVHRILQNLQEFFQILSTSANNPSLRELHLFGDWPLCNSEESILAITLFLRTQNKLKLFWSAMNSSLLEGCLIMDGVSQSSASIIELDLVDHFEDSVERGLDTTYRYLSKYSNLITLELQWRDFSERLLCTLAINCRNTLKFIGLVVFSRLQTIPKISSKCWENATAMVPQLRVRIYLDLPEDVDLELLKEFLPSSIPVIDLCVWGNLTEPKFLHYYYQSFSNTLESAELHQPVSEEELHSPEEPIDDAVLAFVSHCAKLKSLHVYGKPKIKSLSEIIHMKIYGCINNILKMFNPYHFFRSS